MNLQKVYLHRPRVTLRLNYIELGGCEQLPQYGIGIRSQELVERSPVPSPLVKSRAI